MKTLLSLFFGLTLASLASADTGWSDNFEHAKSEAQSAHKKILLDFTGSDWCGWCKKLSAEVFSQQEFKDYAAKHLVLVKVDFPQGFKLPAHVKKQNDELAAKYRIHGFPTIVVLTAGGKQIGETGYIPGGPTPFLRTIEKMH